MVVNKGKGGKVPPKITKKSNKIKPKVARDGKVVSVSNKGPAKRNKMIKTKAASKLLNRNETRSTSLNRKTRKVSEVDSSKSSKRKSSSDSPKGKVSSPASKNSLKVAKSTKATPVKTKDTKNAKASKDMASPTTTSRAKNNTKGNLTPPRQTRGGSKVGTLKPSQDKSPSKKQSPTKVDESKTKNVRKQVEPNKSSIKGSPQKQQLKKVSVDKSPKTKSSTSKSLSKVTKNIKEENEANKSPKKGKISQKTKGDATRDGESMSSTSSKGLSKVNAKDKLTRKDVSFVSKKMTTNSKNIPKTRGKLDNQAHKKSENKNTNIKSTKDHVITRKGSETDATGNDMKGKSAKPRQDGNEKAKSVTRKAVVSESSKSNKVEKRKPKISKAKLAQRQIKRMQALGLLGAPPRRAASLNAASMIHITEGVGNNASVTSPPEKPLFENTVTTDKKDRPNAQTNKLSLAKKEKEVKTESKKNTKSPIQLKTKHKKIETQSESSDSENSDDSESEEISFKATRASKNNKALEVNKSANNSNSEKIKDKIIRTQKKKITGTNKLRDVVKVSSPFISSSESEEDDEEIQDKEQERIKNRKKTKNSFTSTTSEESLDTSRESNTAGTKRKTSKSKKRPQKIKKRKKTLRDEFNMDIRDMIVKKRIASLNASAIMSASYSTPAQNDKNEMTNGKISELSASNYEASMAEMPKHLPAFISKMEEANSSTLATDITPQKTSSKSSRKSLVKSAPTLSEPNRVGRGSLTPNSEHSSLGKMKQLTEKEKKKQKLKEKKRSKENNDNKRKEKSKPTFSTPINSRLGDFDDDSTEPQHIIVEINDERIKSQLIASAMKKAGSGSSKTSPSSILPLKKRQVDKRSEGGSKLKNTKSKKGTKRKSSSREVIVTLSSSSSDEDEEGYDKVKISSGSHSESSSGESDSNSSKSEESEEEIEEICTEGARATANNQVIKYNHIRPSSAGVQGGHPALNTELNKVDVIVDGRSHSVVAGMAYQVVQRVETISTTTAVVPRFRAPGPRSVNDQVRRI